MGAVCAMQLLAQGMPSSLTLQTLLAASLTQSWQTAYLD